MASPKLPAVVSPLDCVAARARMPEIRLLDVRTPVEFGSAHIEGAYNIPLDRLQAYAAELRAVSAPVVLVCRTGARARSAEGVLRRAGMGNVHLLEGGMLAWRASALPVQRDAVTAPRLLRWGIAAMAVLAGMFVSGEFPLLTAVLFFVGLRIGVGQSLLPCAAGGCGGDTCAPGAEDAHAVVRRFVTGQAPTGPARIGKVAAV